MKKVYLLAILIPIVCIVTSPSIIYAEKMDDDLLVPGLRNHMNLMFENNKNDFKGLTSTTDSLSIKYKVVPGTEAELAPILMPISRNKPVFPTLLAPSSGGTLRIVNNEQTPAIGGENMPLAGSLGSPFCIDSGEKQTTNDFAQNFVTKFPSHYKSIVGVIQVSNSVATLIGTAVIIDVNTFVTAGHVFDRMNGNKYIPGATKLSIAGNYLLLELDIAKFPRGLPQNHNWDLDPLAVPVSKGTLAFNRVDTGIDLAVFKIGNISAPPLTISSDELQDGSELALIGVPGVPEGEEANDPKRYTKNYSVCGLPNSSSILSKPPVVLRVGTGKLVMGKSQVSKPTFHFNINTLGGNSGSPVFNASTGKIVGINVATEHSYASNEINYNIAVKGKSIVDILNRFKTEQVNLRGAAFAFDTTK